MENFEEAQMLFTYKKMFKWFWFNLTKTRRNVPQTDKIVIKFLLALLADWINWMKIKSLKVDIFASQTTFKMILIFTDKLISKISNAFLDALVPLGLGLLISFFSCKKNDSSRDRIFVFYEFCSLLVVVVLCFFSIKFSCFMDGGNLWNLGGSLSGLGWEIGHPSPPDNTSPIYFWILNFTFCQHFHINIFHYLRIFIKHKETDYRKRHPHYIPKGTRHCSNVFSLVFLFATICWYFKTRLKRSNVTISKQRGFAARSAETKVKIVEPFFDLNRRPICELWR